jgi:hypothetical protein
MSYDPNTLFRTEIQTAWNTSSQNLPNNLSTLNLAHSYDFELNTVGLGNGSITSNHTFKAPHGLNSYWTGDLRANSDTGNPSTTTFLLFCIAFLNSDGDESRGNQKGRENLGDDMCYGIYTEARLRLPFSSRVSGSTIQPWVRIIGFIIKKGVLK